MRRPGFLVLLGCILLVFTRAAYSIHNITAALVALAPVGPEDERDTALTLEDPTAKSNAGSVSMTNSLMWIGVTVAVLMMR